MAVVSAVLAAAQLLSEDMFFELYFTAGCALALSIAMFACMPARLAKATLFLFLTNTTSVSFGSAMQYWFTVDETCNPGGPHFDYLFFTVYTAVVAQVRGFPNHHTPPLCDCPYSYQKGLLRPEGRIPSSNPSYYGVQYTLSNPSYQSLIHMVRETDTFGFYRTRCSAGLGFIYSTRTSPRFACDTRL